MNFVVTARKWRPNKFEDVVGQEHISITLKNTIKNNRIAHAYIFAGPRGVGKTTTARIFAKTLNCLNPIDNEPCNTCEMCHSFNSSQSLDIIEIDGASNRRIEEIRTLRESVKYTPTKGKYKVYIIDEVHMLTNESFNALLKTLEEPPEHTIFIFATTDVHKVPLTIISRCQRFDFRRIELNEIKNLLAKIAKAENIEIDDQSLTIIAKKADGALRDAESIFDQIISFSGNKVKADEISKMLNLIDEEIYFTLIDAIINRRFIDSFNITKLIYDNGWNFVDFLNGLLEHFRNLMTAIISDKSDFIESSEEYKTRYIKYKNNFSESDILRILNLITRTIQELRFSVNTRLSVEILLNNIIGIYRSGSISDVIDSLDTLKKKIISTNLAEENSEYSVLKTSSKSEITNIETVEPLHDEKEFEELQNNNIKHETLSKDWNSFLNYIEQEKPFVSHYLKSFQVEISDNKISLRNNDLNIFQSIIKEKPYLEDKLLIFFQKALYLNIAKPEINQLTKDIIEKEDTPLIKSIKEKLDGREIL